MRIFIPDIWSISNSIIFYFINPKSISKTFR